MKVHLIAGVVVTNLALVTDFHRQNRDRRYDSVTVFGRRRLAGVGGRGLGRTDVGQMTKKSCQCSATFGGANMGLAVRFAI
jgi:hypothetical protein